MVVHVITHSVKQRYQQELEQNFRLRHKVFAERQNWKELQKPDKRDIDQFDNKHATHMLVLENGSVVGGSRLNSLTGANLTVDLFSSLLERPFPDTPNNGADWTRFYVWPQSSVGSKRSEISAQIYCGMMEYAVLQGYTFLTFISTIYMLELLTAMGWNTAPLGMPQKIEGKPTVAGWIEVSAVALDNARAKFNISDSVLVQRPGQPLLPMIDEDPTSPNLLH